MTLRRRQFLHLAAGAAAFSSVLYIARAETYPAGVDAVHAAAQPIGAGNAEMEFGKAAQEGEVRLAPIDDVVVIVAARDRAAHHQEQHLAQRIHGPCRASVIAAK
jgi:hypothetical protein